MIPYYYPNSVQREWSSSLGRWIYGPPTPAGWAPSGRLPGAGGSFTRIGVSNPATIFHRMDEVDAAAKATDAAVTMNLAPGRFTQDWTVWFARWQRFNESERSLANLLSPAAWILRSDELEREVEARASQLNELRAQYPSQRSKTGGAPPPLSGPSVPVPPRTTSAPFPVATVAAVVGIVAVAAVAIVFAPEIKTALRLGRR